MRLITHGYVQLLERRHGAQIYAALFLNEALHLGRYAGIGF